MAKQDKQDKQLEAEKKKIKDEKKKLKEEQKNNRKEAKKRAKEIALHEAELSDDNEGGTISTFIMIFFIVLFWLGILAVLVKLDVGGFGSNVLKPILKDVPIVQYILPEDKTTETDNEEAYYGYSNLKDAVEQIKLLEQELTQAQAENLSATEELATLKAEVSRLKTFEDNQVEFQRIKTEFYEEVIYAEKGPGAEEYQKYYEAMDPTTAEYLYKQVVQQLEASTEAKEYALAYSTMKPKAAAGIFEQMTDDLELAAEILGLMEAANRGDILGAMDPVIAAKLTKIMNPDS